jgi:hypothetical protein
VWFEYIHDHLADKSSFGLILKCHTVVEWLLIKLIETQLKMPDKFDVHRLSFPQKVDMCIAFGLVEKRQKKIFLRLNEMRNKFAHTLDYEITFDEAFEYVSQANNAGIDFSDETIFKDKEQSKEMYGTIGILIEVISNLSLGLICTLMDYGVDVPQ